MYKVFGGLRLLGVDVSEKKLVESGKHGVIGDILRDFVLAGVEYGVLISCKVLYLQVVSCKVRVQGF